MREEKWYRMIAAPGVGIQGFRTDISGRGRGDIAGGCHKKGRKEQRLRPWDEIYIHYTM